MADYKIVFTDYYYPNNNQELEIFKKLGNVDIVDLTKIEKGGIKEDSRLLDYTEDADAIIVQVANITKKVIDNLKKCRIISRYAIGVDNIDLEAAKSKGIIVSNVPDYCIEEVSNNAVTHIMNCSIKLSLANKLVLNKEWDYAKIKPVHRLSNQTLGLVAFGNIARRVAEKMRPYDIRIIAYDPFFSDNEHKYDWVEFVDLDCLFKQSDIISVHAPLNKNTYHMINKEGFASMKDGVIIVNTSRGGVVEEEALVKAIEEGKVAMAGLDALEADRKPREEYYKSRVFEFPDRIIITPHMAWYSEDSIKDLQKKVALNVYEMLKNGKPIYSV
jgi:D-3-phosphoglycerate dehydrogenase